MNLNLPNISWAELVQKSARGTYKSRKTRKFDDERSEDDEDQGYMTTAS